jgi:signal transduction histidine kinase
MPATETETTNGEPVELVLETYGDALEAFELRKERYANLTGGNHRIEETVPLNLIDSIGAARLRRDDIEGVLAHAINPHGERMGWYYSSAYTITHMFSQTHDNGRRFEASFNTAYNLRQQGYNSVTDTLTFRSPEDFHAALISTAERGYDLYRDREQEIGNLIGTLESARAREPEQEIGFEEGMELLANPEIVDRMDQVRLREEEVEVDVDGVRQRVKRPVYDNRGDSYRIGDIYAGGKIYMSVVSVAEYVGGNMISFEDEEDGHQFVGMSFIEDPGNPRMTEFIRFAEGDFAAAYGDCPHVRIELSDPLPTLIGPRRMITLRFDRELFDEHNIQYAGSKPRRPETSVNLSLNIEGQRFHVQAGSHQSPQAIKDPAERAEMLVGLEHDTSFVDGSGNRIIRPSTRRQIEELILLQRETFELQERMAIPPGRLLEYRDIRERKIEHDLRTPMTSIRAAKDMLAREVLMLYGHQSKDEEVIAMVERMLNTLAPEGTLADDDVDTLLRKIGELKNLKAGSNALGAEFVQEIMTMIDRNLEASERLNREKSRERARLFQLERMVVIPSGNFFATELERLIEDTRIHNNAASSVQIRVDVSSFGPDATLADLPDIVTVADLVRDVITDPIANAKRHNPPLAEDPASGEMVPNPHAHSVATIRFVREQDDLAVIVETTGREPNQDQIDAINDRDNTEGVQSESSVGTGKGLVFLRLQHDLLHEPGDLRRGQSSRYHVEKDSYPPQDGEGEPTHVFRTVARYPLLESYRRHAVVA